jgi:hypothetical protein
MSTTTESHAHTSFDSGMAWCGPPATYSGCRNALTVSRTCPEQNTPKRSYNRKRWKHAGAWPAQRQRFGRPPTQPGSANPIKFRANFMFRAVDAWTSATKHQTGGKNSEARAPAHCASCALYKGDAPKNTKGCSGAAPPSLAFSADVPAECKQKAASRATHKPGRPHTEPACCVAANTRCAHAAMP